MKLLKTFGLVVASLLTISAFACENPPMASVPDGASSTMDELLAAQATVKTYMAGMEEYLACLNEELESGGEEAPAQFKSLMVTRHNSAVSEMETIAASFNEEIQAYRAANPDPE